MLAVFSIFLQLLHCCRILGENLTNKTSRALLAGPSDRASPLGRPPNVAQSIKFRLYAILWSEASTLAVLCLPNSALVLHVWKYLYHCIPKIQGVPSPQSFVASFEDKVNLRQLEGH
ncbi:MAG: hypothetical protein ACTS73_00505 [Arsenophonus sp. NEOnobi-MAG3]